MKSVSKLKSEHDGIFQVVRGRQNHLQLRGKTCQGQSLSWQQCMFISCDETIVCAPLLILLCHLCISVSFEPLYGPPPRGAQAPSQLWPKVEARVRGPCARNAPSSWQVCRPPCFISQCRGMQCYIHLRCLGRADLTLPEEVGPYLCKWQRERGLIPPSLPSFIPRDSEAAPPFFFRVLTHPTHIS